MPALTPKLDLPYPIGSDDLGDTDLHIKALAEAIEDNLRPAFSVSRAVAQAIPDSAITSVSFDTELYDPDAMFAPTSANVTVKTAGLWLLIGGTGFAAGTAGRRFVTLKLGAAELQRVEGPPSTSAAWSMQAVWMGRLAVNDVLNLAVFQVSGGALNTSGAGAQSPKFQGTWVGP